MKRILSLFCLSVFLFAGQDALACPTYYTAQQEQGYSDSICLATIAGTFNEGEVRSESKYLEKGSRYLFSASGCPRVGQIGIYLRNQNGQLVKEASGTRPSLRYTADKSGNYSLFVKVLSLRGNNTWGDIDSCFSKE